MRRRLLGMLASLVALLCCASVSGATGWRFVRLGQKLPRFSMPKAKGGGKLTLPLAGAKGTVVLYVRADQGRSKGAVADVTKLLGKYRGKGLRAVAVATPAHGGEQTAKKLAQGAGFPVAIDVGSKFRGKCGLFVYPTTGLVDAKGVLRDEITGHHGEYLAQLEVKIRKLLGLAVIKKVKHDLSPAELRKRRMKRMMRRMEERRARRRFFAARSLLDSSLPRVLKLYREWAALQPPPEHEALAKLASEVAAGKPSGKTVAALRKLADAAPKKVRPAARLWLGRALARAGKKGEAAKVFEACRKAGPQRGHCAFELAQLAPKRAPELCKRGFTALQASGGAR